MGLLPITEYFAAGYGGEVLISVRVDATREKMYRAVAEEEIRPPRVLAVIRIGVVDREILAWQVRGVAGCGDQGFVEVRIVVGGAGGRGIGLGGGYGRVPRGASCSGHGAGPGAGGMVAGALADDNGVAQTIDDASDIRLAVAIKQAVGGRTGGAGQAVVSD